MDFHSQLKLYMNEYVRMIYKFSKKFPKDELYGVISQLRRASLSVILNYIEGYARNNGNKDKVYKNFLEISYGSLKESKYLVYFSFTENYIMEEEYKKSLELADKIGAMLWGILKNL